jgi:hypothetical protein
LLAICSWHGSGAASAVPADKSSINKTAKPAITNFLIFTGSFLNSLLGQSFRHEKQGKISVEAFLLV